MNYEILKNYIEEAIRDNDRGEITAEVLRDVLLNTVNTIDDGYIFGGAVYPTDTPRYTDAKVVYIAMEKGVYANFGGVELGGVGFIYFDDTWRAVTFIYNDIRVVSDKGRSAVDAMSQAGATALHDEALDYVRQVRDALYQRVKEDDIFLKNYIDDTADILPFYDVYKVKDYVKGYAPADGGGLVVYDAGGKVFRLRVKDVFYEYWNEISASDSITGRRILSWEYYNTTLKNNLIAKSGLYRSLTYSNRVYVCIMGIGFNELMYKEDITPGVYHYKVNSDGRLALVDADLIVLDCTGRTLSTTIVFQMDNLQKRIFRINVLAGSYPVYIENSGFLLNGSQPRVVMADSVTRIAINPKMGAGIYVNVIYLPNEDANYPNGLVHVELSSRFNI